MAKDNPTTQSQLGKHDAKYWLREIEAAKIRLAPWYDKVCEAEDRYRDEDKRAFGRLNIYWANVETQKAAIGEDFGKPEVRRVNAPEDDDGLSRHVAEVWQRTIIAAVRDDDDNHDIGLAVGDVFIPGRGQVWQEVDASNKAWVRAPLVRVMYDAYLEGEGDRWGAVPWVGRRHKMTEDDLVNECGMSREKARKVPMDHNPLTKKQRRKMNEAEQSQFKRAIVWEIWTKYPDKYRIYIAEGYGDDVLRCDPDPLRLKNFFPCPRPMLANGDEGWQMPLTDYSRYEDQARELDVVCARIYILTELLRWRGVFDAKHPELQELMKAADTVFMGVESWAELTAAGGLQAALQALDITPLSVILAGLAEQRRSLIDLIYELSGISDLARGSTDPGETLGAQKLKKTYGSNRFRKREAESRRLASEAYAIKGEVIAENYGHAQFKAMSGMALPLRAEIEQARGELQQFAATQKAAQETGRQLPAPDPKHMKRLQRLASTEFSWEEIEAVLESDDRRCYVLDVETDQSEFVDSEVDQQNRSNFFQMVMSTFERVGPFIQGNPKAGEVYKQIIMWVISAFKSGRSME
jgi:hypothetical protein